MQERRKKYEDNPRLAWDILEAGSARARKVAGGDHGRSPRSHGHVAGLRSCRTSVARQTQSAVRTQQNSPTESRAPTDILYCQSLTKVANAEPLGSIGEPAARTATPARATDKQKEESDFPSRWPSADVYEGPLDLLLDLIRKQDIDIYDIPIAKITAQYLTYVESIRELDVNVAAEFIYMAAVLIHIKSKMLLPRDPAAAAEAEDDPRDGTRQPPASSTKNSSPRRKC